MINPRLDYWLTFNGALLSLKCDTNPEPFTSSNGQFTFAGEINHNLYNLLSENVLNWLLQSFYTKG